MNFKGKIFIANPEQSGVSKRTGNPWNTRELVFESENNERVLVKAGTDLCGDVRELLENHKDAVFEITYWSSVRNYVKNDGTVIWMQDNSLGSIKLAESKE